LPGFLRYASHQDTVDPLAIQINDLQPEPVPLDRIAHRGKVAELI
jgi:hypothetical protein